MPTRGFEWFVAWRHLSGRPGRMPRTMVVGFVLLLLGAGVAYGATRWQASLEAPQELFLPARQIRWLGYAKIVGLVAAGLGGLFAYLGGLFSRFTVFTSFSIFGVFLGTAAPIVALSVMSGFEADLKNKIRGWKADVVVESATDKPFVDWRPLLNKIETIPNVMGAAPYLETELMIFASNTPSGIMLRGIEPESAKKVLDLSSHMKEGSLADLKPADRAPDGPEHVEPPPLPTDEQLEPPGEEDNADGTHKKTVGSKKSGKWSPSDPEGATVTLHPALGPETPAIVLGEELFARTLRLFVGDGVDLMCPLCGVGPTGPIPKSRPFRVVGHFKSGMYEYDSKLAYVHLAEAQRLLGTPGEITGIDVRTRSADDARAVADQIHARLGPGYRVRTWEDLNRALFLALRLEKIAMFVALAFIGLVASFSIVSNLFMLVTEKAREVAILKGMGATDQGIRRLFLLEGAYIGLLGSVVGAAVGVAACLLMETYGLPLPSDIYYIDQLPVVMRPLEVVGISAVALALAVLAAVYPAILASRLRPVEGLRYE
ncbi:MAG: ABC transporter permease [Deltaproteobacteria bacterium]|nr:ABC transporter permease [Deltaproteobacteria bacterium]